MVLNFKYGTTRIQDLRITDTPTKPHARIVEVDGTVAISTPRFWQSIALRYGISQRMFRYFPPDEVLKRVAQIVPDDKVSYCLEHFDQAPSRLLAVANPNRPRLEHDDLKQLLHRSGGSQMSYVNGVVSSTHNPRCGDHTFEVSGDQFKRRFIFEAAIDGFGQPRIYTSFLRLLCVNGIIGYCRAFRSDIKLGTNTAHSIRRAIDSFDDVGGYDALGQRFESAQTSWASLRECIQLQNVLKTIKLKKGASRQHLGRGLERTTGNLNEIYGLANLKALSAKRQRVLPSRSRVYDLLNFASEVATHHAKPSGARVMQAFIGNLISDEYDMEGTAEAVTDFTDFLVRDVDGADVDTPASTTLA